MKLQKIVLREAVNPSLSLQIRPILISKIHAARADKQNGRRISAVAAARITPGPLIKTAA